MPTAAFLRSIQPPRIVAACARWASSPRFRAVTIALIIGNAVLIGIETDRAIAAAHADLFAWLHGAILVLFLGELAIRIIACGRAWPGFFRSGWNLFDVAVVAASLIPAVGAWATVARLARVLRVARLVSVSPQLRLIIATMLRSVPSLGHVGLLLGLLLYLYAVVGVELFGAALPEHWGTLGRAILTLFQVLTLEGWVELQRACMEVHAWAWLYFTSFVLIAVFVVVNLFIAVVLNNLDQARHELAGSPREPSLGDIATRLDAIERALRRRDDAPGP